MRLVQEINAKRRIIVELIAYLQERVEKIEGKACPYPRTDRNQLPNRETNSETLANALHNDPILSLKAPFPDPKPNSHHRRASLLHVRHRKRDLPWVDLFLHEMRGILE